MCLQNCDKWIAESKVTQHIGQRFIYTQEQRLKQATCSPLMAYFNIYVLLKVTTDMTTSL